MSLEKNPATVSTRSSLVSSKRIKLSEDKTMGCDTISLSSFPNELLLHIMGYCATDAPTLCALDATCTLFRNTLTESFWTELALELYGSGKSAKRSYLAGRALTTRPPVRFRLENPPLHGNNRYSSCLAASNSLIVMGVTPHANAETRERLTNFPIQVLSASNLEPISCALILHEPCLRVALVGDVVVLQTCPHTIWACHGCTKVKIILPSSDDAIRGIAGSEHGLAIVQDATLCLFRPSTHAALAEQQTIELDGLFTSRPCALSWSTCHGYLAYAGGAHVMVWKWNPTNPDGPLELLVDFLHGMPLYYGGNVAVSDKYVVLSQSLSQSDEVKVYQLSSPTVHRRIFTSKDASLWSGLHNAEVHLCIITHFLVITSGHGVGLMIYDLRDGKLVRELHSEERSELHDMVRLSSMTSLSFMVTFSGGDQMVWGFEGCQELL